MDDDIVRRLLGLLERTCERLDAAGARDEAIAMFRPARRRMLVPRPSAMLPLGRAWRLGVLLLDRDRRLFETGAVTRAVEPGRVTNQSIDAEVRREHRRAAFAGPFARGEVVNFDIRPVELLGESLRADDGRLSIRGEIVVLRWGVSSDEVVPLEEYLVDRTRLLLDE